MAQQRQQSRSSAPEASDKQRPEHTIRLRNIRAAIWKNETESGARYNVTISRFYRDGEQWKNSDSFGRDDLLTVAEVGRQCYLWICETVQGEDGPF